MHQATLPPAKRPVGGEFGYWDDLPYCECAVCRERSKCEPPVGTKVYLSPARCPDNVPLKHEEKPEIPVALPGREFYRNLGEEETD